MNPLPRWIKVALTSTLLVLIFGGGWFYHAQEQTLRQEMETDLSAVVRLKASQIAAWREDRFADAAVLMENPRFVRGVARLQADPRDEDAHEFRALFESLAKHHGYADIVLVDRDGRVRLSLTGQTEVNAKEASALAVALHDGKPEFTELHRDAQMPTPHLFVIAPLFTGEKAARKAIGAVILVCDASRYLYPLVQSWPTPTKTAETLLVRRDGNDVLFLNDLRFRPDTALKLSIPLSRTDVPAVMAVLGHKGVMLGKDYRGVDVVSVLMPIPNSPWFMVGKIDTSELFAEWRFRSILILALLMGLAGLTVVAVLVVRQREQKKHYRELYRSELALRQSAERHSITLKAIGDAVIATDAQGLVELLNPVAETLTGWSDGDARGRPLEEIFRIVNEHTLAKVESPVARVIEEGVTVGLANHTVLIAKDGAKRSIADSGAPVRSDDGTLIGVVLVFRDQSAERTAQRLTQARMELTEYAAVHTLSEFLRKALDEVGVFVDSPIGFYHFVESDQETLSLQQWSTRTSKEFCGTENKDRHYGIDRAGVWVDCVKERKPVIHNDYLSLEHKKGMPEGHAEVVRELVTPVMRQGKVVAILGVGNKPFDYTEKDADVISYLADVTWEIVERKRTAEALQDSEKRYRRLFESAKDGILILDYETGRVVDANPFTMELLGYSCRELCEMHIWDIGCFKDITDSKTALATLQENEFIRYNNLSLETMGGQCIDVEFVSNVYIVDHAKVIQCNIRDMTERKREEKILSESEKFKKAILDSVNSHIAVLDRNGVILSVNERWVRFSIENSNTEGGPANNSGRGVNYLTVCLESHGESSEEAIAAHDGILAVLEGTLPGFSVEYPCHSPGVKRWFTMTVSPLGTEKTGVVISHTDITDRKLAELNMAKIASIVQYSDDAIIGKDLDGIVTSWNRGAESIYGFSANEMIGKPVSILIPPGQEDELPRILGKIMSGEHIVHFETVRRRKDGRDINMSLTISPVRNPEGGIVAASTIGRDITELKKAAEEREKLHAQLSQAQKMESIGRLAGGVAHDFNNMLGVILGHAEMAMEQVDSTHPLHADLQEIQKAALRSADLTRQLLAFARKQTIAPRVLDLNETVEGMLKMLRRLIGEDIDLAWLPDNALWPVKVDPGQIDQLLANLCVNARDAISGVGKVTIETGATLFDNDYCSRHQEVVPGEFVMLAVSDSGCGMDRETLDKIFEPFFTTKAFGEGTGLGLATVYGIVRQNNGFINVYSEPGQGTTFKIYLPRAEEQATEKAPVSLKKDLRGKETVLLVEDEEPMLALGKTILLRHGYQVLAARSPTEALGIVQSYPGPIHLLITDVVMPEMNGKDLRDRLTEVNPGLKSIFMSGYTANVIAHHGILDENIDFLQKPFSVQTLLEKARDVLDG